MYEIIAVCIPRVELSTRVDPQIFELSCLRRTDCDRQPMTKIMPCENLQSFSAHPLHP